MLATQSVRPALSIEGIETKDWITSYTQSWTFLNFINEILSVGYLILVQHWGFEGTESKEWTNGYRQSPNFSVHCIMLFACWVKLKVAVIIITWCTVCQDLCRQRMQGKSSEKPEPLHAASRIGSVSESQVRSPSSRSSTSSWWVSCSVCGLFY